MNLDYLLPPLIAAVISIGLLAVLLAHKPKKQPHWILTLLLTSTTLWALAIFGMRSSPDVEHALFWDKAAVFGGFAVPIFFYHLSLVLTRTEKQKNLLRASYLVLALVLALSPTPIIVQGMERQSYGYAPVFGPAAFLLIFGFGYFLSGMAIYNLFKAYRTCQIYDEKNRLLFITIGMFFPVIGAVFEILPTFYPTAMFGNIIFCLLTSVALLRYHLLDVHVVMRKGLAYFLISALVALPYVGLILLFTHVFKIGLSSVWVYVFVLVIMAIALQPVWSWVQHQVNKWFHRQSYDFLKELEDFSQETHDISDLTQLCSSVVNLVRRALQSSGVHLLLSSGTGAFTTTYSVGAVTSQATIDNDSPLLPWFQTNNDILYIRTMDTIPQFQSLTRKERGEFQRIGAELLIPLKTKPGEVVGIIILAQKLSEQPYSREEERLVLSVASRVAVELENARLYASEKTLRKELQAQDELKTEFLHSVAHELKTPLTAILSSSELLSEEPTLVGDLRNRLISNVRRSAQSMDRRVAELLNLARMRIQELEIEPEPLEIGSFITDVAAQLSILFENKQQTLRLEIPDSLPLVNADKGKLEEVFFNLLSNANKFSPSSSEIVLRAKAVEGRITVEVEDSAPAITEEEKKRLFDAYYRGEDAEKRRRFPGIGLGLYISKKLVELHQGKIWVESKLPKGNIFAFSLPALEPATEETR